jgi:hypothetical protein
MVLVQIFCLKKMLERKVYVVKFMVRSIEICKLFVTKGGAEEFRKKFTKKTLRQRGFCGLSKD